MNGSIEPPFAERDFTFRALAHADLPLMYRWLNEPTVVEWWDAPPPSLDDLEGKYVPRIDGGELIYGVIASFRDIPMAFLQWYRLATEPLHPAVGLVPDDYGAIDLFIGEPTYLNRGLGPIMIRAFLRNVLFMQDDILGCAIDPDLENLRAIVAYERVGFERVGTALDPESGRPDLVMVISRAYLIGG